MPRIGATGRKPRVRSGAKGTESPPSPPNARHHVPAATAAERATETLDRACNRKRIHLAGIDLDQHPHLKKYQAFYNMGMPPPSHQEMADVIISMLRP